MCKLGDIFYVNFQGDGSVQKKYRPGLIISNNVGNLNSPNVIVAPLTTSQTKSKMPTHVFLKASRTGLKYDSIVLLENPLPIPKKRLGKYMTTLADDYMEQVAMAHLISCSAITYLTKDKLLLTWNMAKKLGE